MPDTAAVAAVIHRWMGRFTTRSMHGWARYVREAGLTMAQAGLLMRLHYHGGCGVRDVAEDFGITSAAASQLIDRLVQHSLVVRSENPDDRRARILTLSDKGREIIDQGMRERFRWVDDLAAALTPAEQHAILVALPMLIAAEERLPGDRPHLHTPHAHPSHRSPSC